MKRSFIAGIVAAVVMMLIPASSLAIPTTICLSTSFNSLVQTHNEAGGCEAAFTALVVGEPGPEGKEGKEGKSAGSTLTTVEAEQSVPANNKKSRFVGCASGKVSISTGYSPAAGAPFPGGLLIRSIVKEEQESKSGFNFVVINSSGSEESEVLYVYCAAS